LDRVSGGFSSTQTSHSDVSAECLGLFLARNILFGIEVGQIRPDSVALGRARPDRGGLSQPQPLRRFGNGSRRPERPADPRTARIVSE
jgi:hypothetical protein